MVTFLLNETIVHADDRDAHLTILEFLRTRKKLCGTKEGCASGDCGACTVVVATGNGDSLDYAAINSCISFVGSLHGTQLITVEHLEHRQHLHPVQRAMVDCHGSQCGFCTPGFIMSLFALYKKPGDKDRAMIEQALSGNLCRCTGYRPILDAAKTICEKPREDQFSAGEKRLARQLAELTDHTTTHKDKTPTFHAPKNADQLADILAHDPKARLCAGSTDLALEVTQQLQSFDALIYLGQVGELLDIQEEPRHYRVGAAVSYSHCHALIRDNYPEFADLLLRLGSLQIRNRGTIGGNIGNASPIGDTLPVLIALRSQIVLQSSSAKRQMTVRDYFLDYKKTALQAGEFIREILLPKPLAGYTLKVYKISKRFEDDISAVLMAIWIHYDGGTVRDIVIACGGMATIPRRARGCERALLNQPLDDSTVRAAQTALARDFQPIDDVRASARYRMRVAQNLLTRLQLELTEPEQNTQVAHHA